MNNLKLSVRLLFALLLTTLPGCVPDYSEGGGHAGRSGGAVDTACEMAATERVCNTDNQVVFCAAESRTWQAISTCQNGLICVETSSSSGERQASCVSVGVRQPNGPASDEPNDPASDEPNGPASDEPSTPSTPVGSSQSGKCDLSDTQCLLQCAPSACGSPMSQCEANNLCKNALTCVFACDSKGCQAGCLSGLDDQSFELLMDMITCLDSKCVSSSTSSNHCGGKPPAAGSCAGRCGVFGGAACSCDDACEYYKDCCSDYEALCTKEAPVAGGSKPNSGESGCGGNTSVGWCDCPIKASELKVELPWISKAYPTVVQSIYRCYLTGSNPCGYKNLTLLTMLYLSESKVIPPVAHYNLWTIRFAVTQYAPWSSDLVYLADKTGVAFGELKSATVLALKTLNLTASLTPQNYTLPVGVTTLAFLPPSTSQTGHLSFQAKDEATLAPILSQLDKPEGIQVSLTLTPTATSDEYVYTFKLTKSGSKVIGIKPLN